MIGYLSGCAETVKFEFVARPVWVMPTFYKELERNVWMIKPYPVNDVRSLFLDSGAFTLWTKSREYAKKHGVNRWEFYRTPAFWEQMERYVDFVLQHRAVIDHHANMDVIGNPKLTWKHQKWLESKGLNPVPIVHYGTSVSWLERYIQEGYKFIGLGGLVGSMRQDGCQHWIQQCFNCVCDTPDRLPRVKLHGFGVVAHSLIWNYPWYSIDSTRWCKQGGYGKIVIPQQRGGEFHFDLPPHVWDISAIPKRSVATGEIKHKQRAYQLPLRPGQRSILLEWLGIIDLPLGEWDHKTGEVHQEGVCTHASYRYAAGICYFDQLLQHIPKYPWPLRRRAMEGGLGLV